MKELDFDELDRAVNSLMTNVPKDESAKDDSINTVALPVSSKSTPAASSVSSSSPLSATDTPVSRPTKPGSVASRRSGRFMDVMHPAATAKKPEQSAESVSRQGVTVVPASNVAMPAPTPVDTSSAVDKLIEETKDDATLSVAIPAPPPATTSHQPQSKSDWPDPLEFHNNQQAVDKADEDDQSFELVQPTSPVGNKQENDTPLASPFLPDAKVEKRPLGGNPPPADTELPVAAQGKEALTFDDPDDQLPASPGDATPSLPAELQNDLVAIESGAHHAEDPTSTPHASEVEEDGEKELTNESSPPATSETTHTEALTNEPDDTPKEPTGPVSIPQQYKEEPSTGTKESGAIYDTDTYHQPLAHPAKKKSGWLWVIWILLILVAGAGAGAALYFSGII